MSQTQETPFLELLYGPHLHLYFKSVANTNMNGFSSSTPNKGLWEAFVYENLTAQSRIRSAAPYSRVIRDKFVEALMGYGAYLHMIEQKVSNRGQQILKHIHDHELSAEESLHFSMFFNIVHNENKIKEDGVDKAKEISHAEFKKLSTTYILYYRVNVKTFIKDLDVPGAYMGNVKRSQSGGAPPTTKLALITSFLPLVDLTDTLPTKLEDMLFQLKLVNNKLFGAVSSDIAKNFGDISKHQQRMGEQNENQDVR